MSPDLATELARVRIVPVVTVKRVEQAVPLARALVAGGLPIVEITLRTEAALDAIAAIAETVRDALVGAGTVLAPGQAEAAVAAGARFLVSPGATPALCEAIPATGAPWLPGAATPSEAMRLREAGWTMLKWFPAEQAGGAAMLKALAAVIPDLRFCPTGGIGPGKARAYLDLPNVVAVGGSWMVLGDAIDAQDWRRIETLAHDAAALAASG